MLSLSKIQMFMAKTLKTSGEFQQVCINEIGQELTFFLDASIQREPKDLPYIVFHKFNKVNDETSDDEYILQFIVAISYDEVEEVSQEGIFYFEEMEKLETIVDSAIGIVKDSFQCIGIDGDRSLYVSNFNVLLTEIGEAEDIQAIVTLRVSRQNYL